VSQVAKIVFQIMGRGKFYSHDDEAVKNDEDGVLFYVFRIDTLQTRYTQKLVREVIKSINNPLSAVEAIKIISDAINNTPSPKPAPSTEGIQGAAAQQARLAEDQLAQGQRLTVARTNQARLQRQRTVLEETRLRLERETGQNQNDLIQNQADLNLAQQRVNEESTPTATSQELARQIEIANKIPKYAYPSISFEGLINLMTFKFCSQLYTNYIFQDSHSDPSRYLQKTLRCCSCTQ